jgi:hypothetical protein
VLDRIENSEIVLVPVPAQPAGLLTLQLFDTTGRAIPSRFFSVRLPFPQDRTLEFKLKTEMPSRDGS